MGREGGKKAEGHSSADGRKGCGGVAVKDDALPPHAPGKDERSRGGCCCEAGGVMTLGAAA